MNLLRRYRVLTLTLSAIALTFMWPLTATAAGAAIVHGLWMVWFIALVWEDCTTTRQPSPVERANLQTMADEHQQRLDDSRQLMEDG